MKNLGSILLLCTIVSCTTVKTTQKKLNSGSYDTAIADALKKLRPNKTKKSAQPYVFLMQEAYEKAQKRDQEKARRLEVSRQHRELQALYGVYEQLQARQQKIAPILPLIDLQSGKQVPFSQRDYFPLLQTAKNRWEQSLTQAATQLLEQTASPKENYRELHDSFMVLSGIQALSSSSQSLADELRFRGTSFVKASVSNATEQIIPKRLETQLLDIPTGAHQNRWAVFHQQPQEQVPYTYEVSLQFEDLQFSPERVQEKVYESEKEVEDGTTILKDEDGNQVKDSLGNAIEVTRYKTLRTVFYESLQQKSLQVRASLVLKSVPSQEVIAKLPLETVWVFRHRFGTYEGDRRALRKSWLSLVSLKQIPFPSNEQLLLDASAQIKGEYLALLRRLPL